ncbi:MAG TPA: hypothetical protein VFH93_07690, partial [Thermoleophilia bacterium]|nr:hypothetical protein [Thermoleophilia bacterium]
PSSVALGLGVGVGVVVSVGVGVGVGVSVGVGVGVGVSVGVGVGVGVGSVYPWQPTVVQHPPAMWVAPASIAGKPWQFAHVAGSGSFAELPAGWQLAQSANRPECAGTA